MCLLLFLSLTWMTCSKWPCWLQRERYVLWGILMLWWTPLWIWGLDPPALRSVLRYGCSFMVFRMSGDTNIQTSENILAIRKRISPCPELTLYLLKGRDRNWWNQSNIYPGQFLIVHWEEKRSGIFVSWGMAEAFGEAAEEWGQQKGEGFIPFFSPPFESKRSWVSNIRGEFR